jgi:hypothetical protein
VSKAETVARLQRLLERVRARAGTRDAYGRGAVAPVMSSALDSEPVEEPVQMSTWTPPPPDEPAPEVGISVDVDYVETTQVAAVDSVAEEDGAGHLDSTERLVVASTMVAYGAADEGGDSLEQSSAEPDAGVEAHAQTTEPPADNVGEEAAEPAPASSRRPVMPEAEDRLARMAFGVEEAPPPLHTPPPESGRVPASPADDFDSDPLEAPRQARHPDEPLIAEATRALLQSSVPVAKLVGGPGRPLPTTFSAILDETLSL